MIQLVRLDKTQALAIHPVNKFPEDGCGLSRRAHDVATEPGIGDDKRLIYNLSNDVSLLGQNVDFIVPNDGKRKSFFKCFLSQTPRTLADSHEAYCLASESDNNVGDTCLGQFLGDHEVEDSQGLLPTAEGMPIAPVPAGDPALYGR